MPYVTNLSMSDVVQGRFPDWANQNTVLIQIQDVDHAPTARFANVKKRSRFVSVYQFRFDDVDNYTVKYYTPITDDQAEDLARIIKHAKENNLNIVVHCHAGLCRSGAIKTLCVRYGFEDIDNKDAFPNALVMKKVGNLLGINKTEDYYKGLW